MNSVEILYHDSLLLGSLCLSNLGCANQIFQLSLQDMFFDLKLMYLPTMILRYECSRSYKHAKLHDESLKFVSDVSSVCRKP